MPVIGGSHNVLGEPHGWAEALLSLLPAPQRARLGARMLVRSSDL
jgi:hypothetical protein